MRELVSIVLLSFVHGLVAIDLDEDLLLRDAECAGWMKSYSDSDFISVVHFNCDKVKAAVDQWSNAARWHQVDQEQKDDWEARGAKAVGMCTEARSTLHGGRAKDAAEQAIKAFGFGIMENSMCCTRTVSPRCTFPEEDFQGEGMRHSVHLAPRGLILIQTVLIAFLAVLTCCESSFKRRRADQSDRQDDEDSASEDEALGPGVRQPPIDKRFAQQLEDDWMCHSLRAMPGANRMARSTANLFAGLRATFDFQQDSVRNQFEHLLSLWRSHISNVADRVVGKDPEAKVNETYLLCEALDELHGELLEGFLVWRERYRACESAATAVDRSAPRPGGIVWEHPIEAALCPKREQEAAERSRQLTEIAVYLCVYGEAGNGRNMPELLYFITELALCSDGPGGAGFYGIGDPENPAAGSPEHSGQFLSKIIRPLYALVFNEWYKDMAGKGVLHDGFARYLPPDTANYDDWNEFFCCPEQVSNGLLLSNGNSLFNLPYSKRFAALRKVQWSVCLKGSQIKTHREVHSTIGVFASTHRIWLLHATLFFMGVTIAVGNPPRSRSSDSWFERPVLGETAGMRLAAVGLLVPFHAVLWALARMEVASMHVIRRSCGLCYFLMSIFWTLLFALPLVTYAAARYTDVYMTELAAPCLAIHFIVSFAGLFFFLFAPAKREDKLFVLTAVPLRLRLVRYLFWFLVLGVKFLLGIKIFVSVHTAVCKLNLIRMGQETPVEIMSANWSASFFEWLMLWATAYFLFCADTAMWFQLGCMVLGIFTVFVQRKCRLCTFAFGDDLGTIPQRMSKLVFPYSGKNRHDKNISEFFPAAWDRIVAYMRYEDKLEAGAVGQLSFTAADARIGRDWKQLAQPLAPTKTKLKMPDIFDGRNCFEVLLRNYCTGLKRELRNPDFKWRLFALSRGLGLPVPRPYRAPYIPGITVLIPHYGETIVMDKGELLDSGSAGGPRPELRCGPIKIPVKETVPLITWLQARYPDEFQAFENGMQAKGDWRAGQAWSDYTDEHWQKICVWATMRMQTLYRTIAGMTLYHPALQAHYEIQGYKESCLGKDVWSPNDCFTCIASMQIYKQFNAERLRQTNWMFEKLPDSFKVAYIDHEDIGEGVPRRLATEDNVHRKMKRRYWSCLIDRHCALLKDGRRTPRYRVELPGFPILGDGKGDNQNHAIIFMRGIFCQCIDANQGAYFEQMLLLPCVLGEFRTSSKGKSSGKRIIGLPEHITSDFGSIGDFAAGSEIAFGTISQRSFAVLGGRMHYGHPDIMNRQYMMQQGGVSKSTKTINLSEDIFAGMDFTLRGDGRKIKHCEYFHLAKGRDMGFNSVLGFHSKLAGGTGEQILTRQMLRLSQVLQLPESLTFYYAHAGYYITQYLVSMSMPLLVYTWLLILVADCNADFTAFYPRSCEVPAAEVMAEMLSTFYSVYILFFLVVTSLPLFAEMWLQFGLLAALKKWLKQLLTCSFFMFIFQAKIIGYYIMAEIRQGGASYVATGRGLPTERRAFVGPARIKSFKAAMLLKGVNMEALEAGAELWKSAREAIKRGVAGATGDEKNPVEPSDVKVRLEERRRGKVIALEITPEWKVNTLPIRQKLLREEVGKAVVAALESALESNPGFETVIRYPPTVTTFLEMAETDWRVGQVGGLFLDYAHLTYYDGMQLLIFVALLVYAGGLAEAGAFRGSLLFVFGCLFLVIFSWLYAPFIFNPYQFSAGYFLDDVKAWYGFFFTNNSSSWKDWYERVQVNPQRGLGRSIADFEVLFYFFAATTWLAQLSMTTEINAVIYNKSPLTKYASLFTMFPPFILSSLYCFAVPVAHFFMGLADCTDPAADGDAGASRKTRKTRGIGKLFGRGHRAQEVPSDDSSSSGSESSGDEAVGSRTARARAAEQDPRHQAEDQAPKEEEEQVGYCDNGVPLAFSAVVVAGLQIIEFFMPLYLCIHQPNKKMFVAGIVLKFVFWKISLRLAESAVSMKTFCKKLDKCCFCISGSARLFVYANQLARDIAVSAYLLVTMSPWVLLTLLNDLIAPRYSIHQMLIYRAAKQLTQDEQDLDLISDDEDDYDTEDSDSAGEAADKSPPLMSSWSAPPTDTIGPPPGGSVAGSRYGGAARTVRTAGR